MSFFESNPIGRILNIFSKDIAEGELWKKLVTVCQCVIGIVIFLDSETIPMQNSTDPDILKVFFSFLFFFLLLLFWR